MDFLNNYLISPTHKWWVDNVWKPSWTKLSAAIYGIPAATVVAGEQLSKFANDTTISSYLDKIHTPNWVPVTLAVIGLVTYVAHGRD